MKARLRSCSVHARSTMHLFQILTEIWNSLQENYFSNLVASMSQRVESVRLQKD